jgi:hypothetical protein
MLISRFLKSPNDIWSNRNLIKKEMAIAKKLYIKFKEREFWEKLSLEFRLNSLAWFLSKDGLALLTLEAKMQKLKLKPAIKYDLGKNKIGEDKKITRKARTIMEFLK